MKVAALTAMNRQRVPGSGRSKRVLVSLAASVGAFASLLNAALW
jgi:hypothetical protein